MNFQILKTAVAKQFERMQQHPMFRVAVEKDALWSGYLAAFPEGTNPLYRTRTEYDCSCCKQFVRTIGDVVAIIDGKLESVWDVTVDEPAFQTVANALALMVKSAPIANPFLHYEKTAGTDRSFEALAGGEPRRWDHFFVNIKPQFVAQKDTIPTKLGETRTVKELLTRSLETITSEAIEAVLDLIAQNSLYRGEENRFAVEKFKTLKIIFDALEPQHKELFFWMNTSGVPGSVTGIRNTSIGTLLVDISEGMELEQAVKKFEAMVAPANYKRPTALVTPAMIAKAKETVAELGLTSALQRRFAVLPDITVNNVLFADRSARKNMGGDVFDDLAAATSARVKTMDKIEEVPIAKFLTDILPNINSIEVLFEGKHANNLVSLIAPEDATAGRLFKWDNNFSWSYNGELADSDMRKAVVARGGSVTGVFRFTHQWNYDKRNASLMDLHVFMPGSTVYPGNVVNDFYGNEQRVGWNHRKHSGSGGVQDVDYVNPAPEGYVPVENITFPSLDKMPEGTYVCKIHNWNLRAPTQGGFKAEIEFGGQVFQYEVDRPLKDKEWITVAEVTLKNGAFTIKHHLPVGESVKTVWGLPTQTFHKTQVLLLSPNHWDGQGVGNKHLFFMLEGCVNDGTARGFYNEFLDSRLDPHRKVLELVGSKLKPTDSQHQLSGLGFSSTQKNTLTCRVKGGFSRTINLVF